MGFHRRGYSISGKGQYNAICDVCRGKFKNYELRHRWDGLIVCEEDWEPRHILDFYKPPRDNFPVPFVRKDVNEGIGIINAVLSADITSPTLGSWTLLPLNTEIADLNNEFNTGTSTFQPTTSGNYNVTASIQYNLSYMGKGALSIYKNGSPFRTSDFVETVNSSAMVKQISLQMSLLNTDTITVRYFVTGTASEISKNNAATFLNVQVSN